MKRFLLLALLTLPVCAEVKNLCADETGVVSVNWVSDGQAAQSLALEGRDESSQAWRPLGLWTLARDGQVAAKMHLETVPGSTCGEYRVLTFGPTGFLNQQKIESLSAVGTR